MQDCFVLRFNLENATNPDTLDRIGALSSLFGIDKSELVESEKFYIDRLNVLSNLIDKNTVSNAKKSLSKKTIAFFGDSLTSDRLSYANIIKRLNIFKSVDIFAVSGTVSSQTLRGFNDKIKNSKYDFISLFIGTNDSALTDLDFPFVSHSEFKNNIYYACEKIKESNSKGILFKLPLHQDRKFSSGQVISSLYNDALLSAANDFKFEFFDLNNIALSFIDDNVHFLDTTQKDIAEQFLKEITK